MSTSRKLLQLLPLLALALSTSSMAGISGKPSQTESGSVPVVSINTPANNSQRFGLGLTFIAGTVEGTDVKEVGVSIRRADTNEEWSATKKGGSFVKGPTGKWLKTTIDGNKWYAPTYGYQLPTLADLLPAGTDEMRYTIYAYARDRAGRRSEEKSITITVKR
jgi:hypothetical protein